eukprot:TRINITY_DN24118_c0_g1_i1.p1 TRINITY_DN24118_c0_g1~~TRINITY_DN24118_c0_g1_i1.p1  ORF type:complete len:310 (+),score=116.98 TRINITY_DN24118_c0_g1_i1:117-1046(+)
MAAPCCRATSAPGRRSANASAACVLWCRLALLLVAAVGNVASAEPTPLSMSDGAVLRAVPVAAGGSVLLALPTVGRPVVQLSLFPCFGRLNWYAAAGFVPTPSNNTFSWAWQSDYPRVGAVVNVLRPNDTVYVRVDAAAEAAYGAGVPGAVFDILPLSNSSRFGEIVPQPTSRQIRDYSQDAKAFTVSLSWQPTALASDSYRVYLYPAAVPRGFITYSACGAEQFMLPVSDTPQVSASSASVSVSSVDPYSPMTLLVVVERPDGYKNNYFPISFNAAGLPARRPSRHCAVLVGLMMVLAVLAAGVSQRC